MSFDNKLNRLVERHLELRDLLATHDMKDAKDFAKLSKEYSDLTDIADAIANLRNKQSEKIDLAAMLGDSSLDSEMKQMAQADYDLLFEALPKLEQQIKFLLLTKDADDERDAILEVRAGTGGEEAGLFAAVLFRMYQRYAANKGWRFEIIAMSDTGLGAIKEASASISGKGVFARLKFESGVHRVQRVPETESSGRVHTSTATVVVLPEAEDVDIHI